MGFDEKKSYIFYIVMTESYGNSTQEIIWHLWKVFTVHFVLILPNVTGKNKFDVHEYERVVETHF